MMCRRMYSQLMRGEFGLDGRLDHLFHLFIRLCDQLSRQHPPYIIDPSQHIRTQSLGAKRRRKVGTHIYGRLLGLDIGS